MKHDEWVVDFTQLRMGDVGRVGGKNASLGEMIGNLAQSGVRVPGGFATTAQAFRDFLAKDSLEKRIEAALKTLNVDDTNALAKAGAEIRGWILAQPFPAELEAAIKDAYQKMQSAGSDGLSVAVRSSATAEDLPDASFAGQQETFLNIHGIENVLVAIKHVFASLYNDRAISYRVHKGYIHSEVALSAGIQRMVRSDLGAAGVMFTLDTESGFDQVVFITAAYGLGETVVQGQVNPDEFYVYKPALAAGRTSVIRRNLGSKALRMTFTDARSAGKSVQTHEVPEVERRKFSISDTEVEELARYAVIIEKHYGRAMDIEWGRDGNDGHLYILQARPETVKASEKVDTLQRYRLKTRSDVLASGRAIGQRIGTNRGGRTCHAAIIARELGIPAVVGCGDATQVLKDGKFVTVSCAEGDTGFVYRGELEIEIINLALDAMPKSPAKITMNVGNPELAFEFRRLPNEGVGLARLEFIIARMIGVHPKAVLAYPDLPGDLKLAVEQHAAGYADPKTFYIEKLVEGVATLGAAFWPKPVIVRLSDFKSNEYSSLTGGSKYEPHEENPMLGFRGASRYIAASFRECFELECAAMRKVRNGIGLTNVELMVPFVRTIGEAKQVIDLLAANGLKRGENGLRIIMMCEIPSNAILADEFLQYFDGFSIGSNDMTQMTLALDRDSGIIAEGFDERDPAVKHMLHLAIQACRKAGKYVGICGQGPSDHPDLAKWLVEEGIESLSLNPDTVVETWLYLAREAKLTPH
jgi:pyruvate,water dikinase